MGNKKENLNKYIKNKNFELKSSNYSFEDLFFIVHNQGDRVFAEILVDYKIVNIFYKDFKDYCFRFANFLKQIDDPKKSYIGIYMENSINWVACFWSLLMLGYKPLLLNCKLPLETNKSIISALNVNTIISTEHLDISKKEILIESTNNYIAKINLMQKYVPILWENEIALSTTATSLDYKVCCYNGSDIFYQVLNANGILSKNRMIKEHYEDRLKLLAFLPFYHIFGLVALYFWFSTFGRTFVFLNDYSGDTILKTIRRHNVTHIFAVPLLWNSIYKEVKSKINCFDEKKQKKINNAFKLSLLVQSIFPRLGQKICRSIFSEIINQTMGDSIKFLISGGGYISHDTLVFFNTIGYPLFNGYGSTEVGITSVELRKNILNRIKGSIGKPFDSIEYKIENNKLLVKGNSICSKIYYKDGTLKNICKDEWFDTKDISECDKAGNYFINGRFDDVIICKNGEKYNPDLLEKNIQLTSVKNFCIFGMNDLVYFLFEIPIDVNLVEKIVIYKEIKSCMNMMNEANYPIDRVCFTTDKICNDNAIKVSRTILKKKICEKGITMQPFSDFLNKYDFNDKTVKNETEHIVTKVFADVLCKDEDSIEINSHFIFDLGGSSLDYCTLLVKLENEFNISFNFKDHSFSTVKEFSDYIIQSKVGEKSEKI